VHGFSKKLVAITGVTRDDDADRGLVLAKSAWLVRLRWLALMAQAVCAFLGVHYGLLAPSDVPAYVGIVSGVTFFNVATQIQLRYWPELTTAASIFLQMAVDVLALSALLGLTGGCVNPLFVLIYLHAALGPLILTASWSKAYLGLTVACLTVICVGSDVSQHVMPAPALPQELRLAAEVLVAIVIWGLTHWFSLAVGRLRQEMAVLQRFRQRSDHLRALGAMAASFSHEFATPLNTAKIRLDRLGRQLPQVIENGEYQASKAALNQCEAVIKDLFESDQATTTAKFSDIDLVAFVQKVCEHWRSGRGDLDLSVSAPSEKIPCKAPQIILAKSLVDILDNAAESGADSRPSIEVDVALTDAGACVSVADRGLGVSPAVKERLGDPFVSTKPGGAGLGLYSANALMEALGGFVKIERRDRGGTVVTLTFPRSAEGLI
jgi:two-component system sensor histidine kinase RegB